jgi:hypothetical protein
MGSSFGEVDALEAGEEETQVGEIEAMTYSGGTRVYSEKKPVVYHVEDTHAK